MFRKIIAFPFHALRWMMVARPIRFTRFGTFYILFSLGVGAAAINTGNNLLYLILGILLGFIVISGFLSDSTLWGVSSEWHPTNSMYAGEKAVFAGHIHKGWFPAVALTVESRWTHGIGTRSFIPWIPARSSIETQIHFVPPQRGRLMLESCRYSTRFPFGLFQKSHTYPRQDRWVVYPRIVRLPPEFVSTLGETPSPHSSDHIGIGAVPMVLRDYRAGDALRQVHWKISAKRQRLIVKEMEEEARSGDLYYLKAWPTGLNSQEMEDFISFIASLVFSAFENGRPVGIAVPERFFEPSPSRQHMHQLLEFLAFVDPAQSAGRHSSPLPLTWGYHAMDIQSLWSRMGKTQ